MKFKKIYIEITNSCNFNCSFCFSSGRPKKRMSLEEFSVVLSKIKPFTNYIYLHVLGEPLLHPQLDKFLKRAFDEGFYVNITTNGGLIERKKETLFQYPPRQINISLHDAEENILTENLDSYLTQVLDFSKTIAPFTYVSLRLWNTTNPSSTSFNERCMKKINEYFPDKTTIVSNKKRNENGLKLADHIFLQYAPRFSWPEPEKTGELSYKTCYALRDHIAILAGGEVVPCCLDADANMLLGNIFNDDLSEILSSSKAQSIKKGFEQRRIVEPICSTCGFIVE